MTSLRLRAALAAAVTTAALAVPVAAAAPASAAPAINPCAHYYAEYQQWNAKAQALYAQYKHDHKASTLHAAEDAGKQADAYLEEYRHC